MGIRGTVANVHTAHSAAWLMKDGDDDGTLATREDLARVEGKFDKQFELLEQRTRNLPSIIEQIGTIFSIVQELAPHRAHNNTINTASNNNNGENIVNSIHNENIDQENTDQENTESEQVATANYESTPLSYKRISKRRNRFVNGIARVEVA
jgi:hypothetical protein